MKNFELKLRFHTHEWRFTSGIKPHYSFKWGYFAWLWFCINWVWWTEAPRKDCAK